MSQRHTKEYLRTGCLLLLFLIVAFYDVVFMGKTFKVTTANSQALPHGAYGQLDNKPSFIPVNGTDSPVLEEPLYEFIKQNLKKGILPLWNPHQATGYPLIGMIQAAIFFPLTFIMYLFPQLYAWDLLILARFFLAGFFTYLFMRYMGFKNTPAIAAGVTFMLSGPMLLLQYWTVNVDMLAPLLLICLDRLLRRTDLRNLAWLALIIALTILGGHPEHIFLLHIFGIIFFVFRIIVLRDRIHIRKSIIYCVLSYILALGMAAFVLFPFFRNLISEFWSGHPERTGLLMEEQRERALTLALPHFFQQVPLTYQWSFSGWWGGYLGTLPLGLGLLSLFNRHKRGLNYFFAGMAFLIISKQYGLPFINWIGYLPIFDVCRYAIHTPHLVALSVAIAAGMGVRTVMHNPKMFTKALIYSLTLLFITGIHLLVLKSTATFPIALKATYFALGVLLLLQMILWLKDRDILSRQFVGILLVGILFVELFAYIHRGRPHRFDSFPKVPYFEFLKSSPERIRSYGIFWAFYPNTASGFGVDDLGYFFGLVPKRFVHFVNTLLLPNHFRDDLRPPALRAIPVKGRKHILDLLNVKYIIAPSRDRLSSLLNNFDAIDKEMNTVYSDEVTIIERPNVFPRVFVVHRAIFQSDRDKTLELLNQIGPQIRGVAIINHTPLAPLLAYLKDTPVIDRSLARIVRYSPNEVIINTQMENPGFLVFSDAYHPDWKVYVNGKDWKLFQTNYLMRSVFLPKGRFQVTYKFEPRSFTYGLYLSLATVLVVLALLIFPLGRKKYSA